jgi:hypothetical protein
MTALKQYLVFLAKAHNGQLGRYDCVCLPMQGTWVSELFDTVTGSHSSRITVNPLILHKAVFPHNF